MDIQTLYNAFLQSSGVCIDTRKLQKNALFFALKGLTFDGNHFAKKALQDGAAFVVVDDEKVVDPSPQVIVVENSLLALQKLATHHRKNLNIPIIALTGSNGKTTTKELVREVLAMKFNVLATEGNLNNHIGVPLTLLQLKEQHQIGIIEMGANHLKEIELLCSIALPNEGYITNFGKAHLEGFGSEAGVIEGKSELYQFLTKNQGQILINGDDPKQVEQTKNYNTVQFGSLDSHMIQIIHVPNNEEGLLLNCEGLDFRSPLHGSYNAKNIAAAIAFGIIYKVPLRNIQTAIASYQAKNNRSQLISIKNTHFILDAYNANPSSMEVALNALAENQSTKKAVIMGDMLELGEHTKDEHEYILNLCLRLKFKHVFTIGEQFKKTTLKHQDIYKFENLEAFLEVFNPQAFTFETVLIKGSRSMKLERLIPLLKSK
ncbi:MAG: UDP-N-acetylmuramoyl-tripeptide--D-alanyl-D-alanine ligase [Flavobacteriaceae bacterium]